MNIRQITLGLVLSWIFSVLFLLFAFGSFLTSDFLIGIVLLVLGLVLFPIANKFLQEKMNFELSKGIKATIIIFGLILFVILIPKETKTVQERIVNTESQPPKVQGQISNTLPPPQKIVSYAYEDFGILCNSDATDLQKKNKFETKFQDQYVQWTGQVVTIDQQSGAYVLKVRHCPTTISYDVEIRTRTDQLDNLLSLKEGQTVTYKAKLTKLGVFDYLYAIDGEIIK